MFFISRLCLNICNSMSILQITSDPNTKGIWQLSFLSQYLNYSFYEDKTPPPQQKKTQKRKTTPKHKTNQTQNPKTLAYSVVHTMTLKFKVSKQKKVIINSQESKRSWLRKSSLCDRFCKWFFSNNSSL